MRTIKSIMIPYISISPSYSAQYWSVERLEHSKYESCRFDITSVSNDDTFSKTSQKKLKNYIDWFVEQSKIKILNKKKTGRSFFYKLAMLTLTLPFEQHHSDQEIKKNLLNQFLVEAKKHWKMNNYIWRAEKQENGNIHFHIVCDVFIPWQEARQVWNRICDKLDLVKLFSARMKEKFELGFSYTDEELQKYGYHVLKKRYKEGKKTGWTNPNSVDIHSLKEIRNVGAYLTKYLTKKENEKQKKFETKPDSPQQIIDLVEASKSEFNSKKSVQGRQWYVSDNIRRYCKNLVLEINEKISAALDPLYEDTTNHILSTPFVTVFKKGSDFFRRKSKILRAEIEAYIERIRILLNPEHDCNCLWNIKKLKFDFAPVKKPIIQVVHLNLFSNKNF